MNCSSDERINFCSMTTEASLIHNIVCTYVFSQEVINTRNISAGRDNPEGSLDALYQSVVCSEVSYAHLYCIV